MGYGDRIMIDLLKRGCILAGCCTCCEVVVELRPCENIN